MVTTSNEILSITLRLILAFIYWSGLGMTCFILSIDSIRRIHDVHIMSLGFASLFLGGTSLVIRLAFPTYWELGLAISVLFYSIGLILLRLHFELIRKEQLSHRIIGFSSVVTTILIFGIIGTIDDQFISKELALLLSFSSLLILSFMALPTPLFFSIKEYLRYKKRQQFIEATGFLFLLMAAVNFYLDFIIGLFDTTFYTITLLIAALSSITLSTAYLIDRSYVYRIPFDLNYIFCFHDSGLNFYQRVLIRSDQEEKDQQAITYLTGVFSAVDAIIKNILQQHVEEVNITSKNSVVYLKRDKNKRIGVGVVTRCISWYLKRSLARFLDRLPADLIVDPRDPSTMRVMDNDILEKHITMLLQSMFPYFRVIRAD